MLQHAYIPYDFTLCHIGLDLEGGEEQLECLCWVVWVPIGWEQQEQGDPSTGGVLTHWGATPQDLSMASVGVVTGANNKLVTKLPVTLL